MGGTNPTCFSAHPHKNLLPSNLLENTTFLPSLFLHQEQHILIRGMQNKISLQLLEEVVEIDTRMCQHSTPNKKRPLPYSLQLSDLPRLDVWGLGRLGAKLCALDLFGIIYV